MADVHSLLPIDAAILLIAAAIFVILVVAAYLVGKCFKARTTRRAIMVGTIS